jgi:hypothetical protein
MIFLTDEELRELTGYAYSSRQIEWLHSNKWRFEVTGQRRPKVSRSYFDSRMAGVSHTPSSVDSVDVRPNFSAIGKVLNRKYGKTTAG